jgi:hypothetical protein
LFLGLFLTFSDILCYVPLPDFTTTLQFQPLPIRARELQLAVWVNLMHTIFCNRKKNLMGRALTLNLTQKDHILKVF